ncbi:sporulation histidine kinase inhibitor Sda [Paenibacillus oenotherae]|uniref:Sporulation histidine kinase inhibitor Sda n=1 Tax=Paenibacillus oenotherae TaxID=1435645 RepID=A0ABS7DAK8_9BACL|nr:sporulation histidine kinase inhibitor Sda [Paenibacillus oenotherae]MBW7476631.1 sporulation histidine kinase inhibitor Sda [Paenibacillus oenotherae]
MEILSDELLVDAYRLALNYKLELDFIMLLAAEMKRRQINPDQYRITA